MKFKDQIHQELQRLWAVGNLEQAENMLSIQIPHGHFHSRLTAVDAIGCAFEHCRLDSTPLSAASTERLQEIAESLAGKLQYLLEPIQTVEIDDQQCVVQMRSVPPQQNGEGTSYYELVARREGLLLSRYLKKSGQPRRVIPANVTREVFQRLAKRHAGSLRGGLK